MPNTLVPRAPLRPGARVSPAGTRTRGLRLGRLGGVEVLLDRSWFVIAALTVVLYGPVMWRLYPGLGWLNLVLALGFAVGLALSVLAHELAHALIGRAWGWPVGRIVLTLMGGHTTFGTGRFSPLSAAVVSLAGPVANLVLAGAGTAALLLAPDRAAGPGWALLQLLVLANGILGLFNLLPGLPLDGGRVVEAVVWRLTGSEPRGTIVAAWLGRAIAVAVGVWIVLRQLWHAPLVLLVLAMIAVFIFTGASQALRQGRLLEKLRPLSAGQLARPALEFPPATPLARVDAAVSAATTGDYHGWTPEVLAREPRSGLLGVLDPHRAAQVPDDARADTAVGHVMDWQPAGASVALACPGHEVLRALETQHYRWVWVLDGTGRPVGVVHHVDIARRVVAG